MSTKTDTDEGSDISFTIELHIDSDSDAILAYHIAMLGMNDKGHITSTHLGGAKCHTCPAPSYAYDLIAPFLVVRKDIPFLGVYTPYTMRSKIIIHAVDLTQEQLHQLLSHAEWRPMHMQPHVLCKTYTIK